ncbi:MAG: cbb3-type cytochrome c oxidase N-terminal domain-containing protein [Burkholderiales bacterium]
MSDFWSGWVMLLMVVNLGITLFLFLWGLRVAIPTQPDGTSGHVWAHGVLREGVRWLPTWWIVMSAAVFVAGFAYLALYPGFGAFKGLLGWTSHGELARDQSANLKLEARLRERIRGKSVEQLAADPEVQRVGQVLFVDNCAACHGRDAQGNPAIGAPNLIDDDWLYGGRIRKGDRHGRHGDRPDGQGARYQAGFEIAVVSPRGATSLTTSSLWTSKPSSGF